MSLSSRSHNELSSTITPDRIERALKAVDLQKELRVVVKNDALPFSTCDPDFRGIVIDLWRDFAMTRDLRYRLISSEDKSYDEVLEELKDGVYDVALGDFSVIHRRFTWGLYSRPYFISTIHIFRKAKNTSGIKIAMENRVITTLLVIIGLMIVVFSIFRSALTGTGIFKSFYATFLRLFMSATTEIVNIEKGDRNERRRVKKYGVFVKIFNMVWIFCVFVIIQMLVAQLISSFVKVRDGVDREELRKIHKVYVIKGSSFVDYARRHGFFPIEVEDIHETAKNLGVKEYWLGDLVLTDEFLRTYKGEDMPEFHRSDDPIILDEYAVVFGTHVPELKFLFDLNLVDRRSSNFITDSCNKFHVRAMHSCTM